MHLLIHGQKRHCDNIAAALQYPRLMGTKTRRMTVRNYIKLARFVHQIK